MRRSPFTRVVLVIAPLTLFGLAGCGDGGVNEVKQWTQEVRKETKVVIPKLAEPKKFAPFVYASKEKIDPFSPAKLAAAFDRLKSKQTNSPFKPDPNRIRDPLEAYSLDAMKMVGTLQKPGLTYALLQVDKVVFQVKVGQYVGQNEGMVTNITDTEVELSEKVQDAVGEWVERKAKLELQETKK
ncbi:pilus assembly protein PilP [soil metagenome]